MAGRPRAERDEPRDAKPTTGIPTVPLREQLWFRAVTGAGSLTWRVGWTWRAGTGPVTAPPVLFAAGCALHQIPEPWAALTAAGIPAAAWGARHFAGEVRRREQRELTGFGKAFVLTRTYAAAGWLSLATLTCPTGAVTWRLLVLPAFGCAVVTWGRNLMGLRHRTETSAAGETPADTPENAQDAPTDTQMQLGEQALIWSRRVPIANSALTDLRELRDDEGPNGFEAIVRVNQGDGKVQHTLASVTGQLSLIAAAYDTIPNLIVVESLPGTQTVNAGVLRRFYRNPLHRITEWTGVEPGSWRFPFAKTTGGEVIYREARSDGKPPHLLVVGTTGSGKSATLRLLIEAMLRIVDTQGRPLTRVVLCDPHRGTSFGPEHGNQRERVAHFASSKADIYAAVAWTVSELDRRLDIAADLGQDPLKVTPDMPHLALVLDEWPKLHDADPTLIPLVRRLLREGRKVQIAVIIGSQGALLEDLGDQAIRDGLLAGGAVLLRTMNSYTQLVTGLGRDNVGDPTALVEEWPDGSSAGGLAYLLAGGTDSSTMVRVMALTPEWLAANPAPDVPKDLGSLATVAAAEAKSHAAHSAPKPPAQTPVSDAAQPAGAVVDPAPARDARRPDGRPDTAAERHGDQVIAHLRQVGRASNQQLAETLGLSEEDILDAIVAAAARGAVTLESGGLTDGVWIYDPDPEAIAADPAPDAPDTRGTSQRLLDELNKLDGPISLAELCARAKCTTSNGVQRLNGLRDKGLAHRLRQGEWDRMRPEYQQDDAAEPAHLTPVP